MPSKICHTSSIPNPSQILKNNKDWPKWNLETHQTLKKRNFTRLLKDINKPPPSSDDPTPLQRWNHSQKTACAIVISKLTPTIAKAMHPHKTLETLLQAVNNYTKPTASEALEMLCSLWTRLSTLHSSRHASITDYCAEARDIEMQYRRLGTGISDAILSCAFIAGLPLDWQEWKIRRTQNATVLVPWDDCSSSTFSFENLVLDALEEEVRNLNLFLQHHSRK
ncbi:hypothetical protein N7481_007601 [Penicillium waksmanii]|uniref:uncharacterized protein n=1 Tax=Penicillium waksmanii TaxID=69791 RepID=UPI0025495991|nr:uncharacterized protein N7481_007601 [Penicillium waksmanii]KAJ5980303.1 hypothetical protein N7481_007601 [Penicillium waksmanii]